MKNIYYNSISLLLAIIGMSVWQAAASNPRIQFFFASPLSIIKVLISDTSNTILPGHLFITGTEVIVGFVIGVLAGSVTGFFLWYSPSIASISRPYIFIIGAVPVFIFAPIVILWFGTGIKMKIALAALGVFFISLTQSYEGAKSINITEFRLLKTYGATKFQILRTVILPASLSWISASLKLSIGAALLGATIGEFISAHQGVGYYMIRAGSLYNVPAVFAGAIYLVILALFLHAVVALIDSKKLFFIGQLSVHRKVREAIKKHA